VPIELRHRTYFVYLDVPKDVRVKLGRRVFRKTLGTASRSVAKRRAANWIEKWKSEIEQARGSPNADDLQYWRDASERATTDEERMIVEARMFRGALRRATTDEERFILQTNLETFVAMEGFVNTDPEAQRFYGQAFGSIIPTKEYLDEWIASLQVKNKTAEMRRATVERLAAKLPMLNDVTRKEVRRWVTELVAELKPTTVQRLMSDCRTYWAYLATIEVVPEESAPFDRLGLKIKKVSWLPYTPEEAVRLLEAAQSDAKLANLIRMAMYTGGRREELCSLKTEHVKADRFEIVDAKTAAGIRTVPIHRQLSKTIKRLVKDSEDGYVLSGLKPNTNGVRGDAIGKKFTRLKKSLNFSDRHAFHSWRGTVITVLERAGVPEGTVQDLVGHERSTLTGSTYSGKSTFEMRQKAINKLVY
jgi:integrase